MKLPLHRQIEVGRLRSANLIKVLLKTTNPRTIFHARVEIKSSDTNLDIGKTGGNPKNQIRLIVIRK